MPNRLNLQTPATHTAPPAEPDFFSAQITSARRFYLPPNPRSKSADPLSVISGGSEHTAPNYRIHRKSFPYLSLEFVAHGEGSLQIYRQRPQPLTPGTLFSYGPRIPHDISNLPQHPARPNRPLVKYFVDFTGPAARRLLRAPTPGNILQTSAPQEILTLFENLIAAGLRPSQFRNEICAALLQHLLLRIAETAVPLGSINTPAFDTYHRCKAAIDDHYLAWHSLPEIAQHCGINPAYLCRLFRRFDHQSPWQYLLRLRMRDAAQRLQTPTPPLVKQVAHDLGFPDPFQFSRTFKKTFGLSPAHFLTR